MRISTGFEIEAPFEAVWEVLLDLECVAPCVPGATVGHRVDESTARGRFRVKLGPVTASYRGTIAITEVDLDSGDVVLRAQASETAGGGDRRRRHSELRHGCERDTTVLMDTDLRLTGSAAQFGGRRSVMQSIADRRVSQFCRSAARGASERCRADD
jgi:uncharacterized protein